MFKRKKKKQEADATEEQDAAAEAEEKEGSAGEEGGSEGAEGEEGGAAGAEGDAAPKSKKKLIIIIAAVVVLLIAIGAGVFFSGILGEGEHSERDGVMLGEDGKPIEQSVYYTLPDFLMNLNAGGKYTSFLKATIVLEIPRESDIPIVEAKLPKLLDAFNTYLRELRPSDLAGSAGLQRLREELLLRATKALDPVKVNDVLFKEILVQ